LRSVQQFLALAHNSSWIIPQHCEAAHAVAWYKIGLPGIAFPDSDFQIRSFQLQSLASLSVMHGSGIRAV